MTICQWRAYGARMDILGWITEQASLLPDPLVWVLGGLFSFMEAGLGLGFVFPAETAVLILSAAIDDPWAAVVMGIVVAVFASVGDHVGYLLGRRFGSGMRDRKVIQKLGVANWDRAVGVLERRGAWAVFLTRLVPVIRTLMPAAAGVAGLRYPAFLAASICGSITWAAVYVGCGVLLRNSLDAVQRVLGNAAWVIVAAAVVVGVAVFLVKRARKRRAPVDADADAVTGLVPEQVVEPTPRVRRVRGVLELLTVARAAFALVIAVVVLVDPGTAVLRSVVFGAGALLLTTVVVRWLVRPRSQGAVERIVDRVIAVGLVIVLFAAHLMPLSLMLAVAVPDLLVALFALSTGARRTTLRTPVLDQVRNALLLVAVVLIAGAMGITAIGFVGALALFTAIVLGGIVAGQYGRRLLAAWEYRMPAPTSEA